MELDWTGLDMMGLDKTRQPGLSPGALTPIFGRADNEGASEEADQSLGLLEPHTVTLLLLGQLQAIQLQGFPCLSQWPHHTLAE